MKPSPNKPLARRLRRDATEAEKKLWAHVRNRQMGGFKFRRQWPIGPYIADFICFEAKLIIELDGGQHTPESDVARTAYLKAQGWTLLRFWNNDVLTNMEGVLRTILDALPSAPSPLVQNTLSLPP
jgi:very-short-patch-repair endonuclease